MDYYLLQTILSAGDGEGWMDILVLVFLAVFYGIGTLIKAKGKKRQEQMEKQSSQKPAKKPVKAGRSLIGQIVSEIQRAAQPEQAPKQRPAAPSPKTQAAVRKYATESKRASQPQSTVASPKESLLSTAQAKPGFEKFSELGTNLQSLPEFTSRSVLGASKPADAVESEYLSNVLAGLSNPDELRTAILYYEILGKPISLREPTG